MATDSPSMVAAEPDDEKAYRLIKNGWLVVVAGVRDTTWIDLCTGLYPQAKLQVFPHDAADHGRLAAGLGTRRDTVTCNARPLAQAAAGDTLDGLRADGRLAHVNYLRIDTAADAPAILTGARRLLRHSRIDIIEIASTAADTETLAPLAILLARYEYVVMRLDDRTFRRLTQEELTYSQWDGHTIAIHARMLASYTDFGNEILDLQQLLTRFGITTRGVIHLGAHEARELPVYVELGAKRVLLVEANPALAAQLTSQFGTVPSVVVAHCAINDTDGPVTLHLASTDTASSILPFKLHQEVYPDITERATIEVPGVRLDSLLASLALDAADFNILAIDIQGAELRALRGAPQTLEAIEAVSIEINFAELYDGCAQVEDIDDFLGERGFDRVATLTPFHPWWGDALYVRRNFALNQFPLQ